MTTETLDDARARTVQSHPAWGVTWWRAFSRAAFCRWGDLAGYQPATGEMIGIFVVAGNLRGVTDGSQSPVQERSNVVLVPMPTLAGAKNTF